VSEPSGQLKRLQLAITPVHFLQILWKHASFLEKPTVALRVSGRSGKKNILMLKNYEKQRVSCWHGFFINKGRKPIFHIKLRGGEHVKMSVAVGCGELHVFAVFNGSCIHYCSL
jgi:hypothetical protein